MFCRGVTMTFDDHWLINPVIGSMRFSKKEAEILVELSKKFDITSESKAETLREIIRHLYQIYKNDNDEYRAFFWAKNIEWHEEIMQTLKTKLSESLIWKEKKERLINYLTQLAREQVEETRKKQLENAVHLIFYHPNPSIYFNENSFKKEMNFILRSKGIPEFVIQLIICNHILDILLWKDTDGK
jgi:hypothetical protein